MSSRYCNECKKITDHTVTNMPDVIENEKWICDICGLTSYYRVITTHGWDKVERLERKTRVEKNE